MLRGGKRLRPAFAYWGWRAVADRDADPVGAAAVRGAGTAPSVRVGARRRDRRLGDPPGAAHGAPAVRREAPRPPLERIRRTVRPVGGDPARRSRPGVGRRHRRDGRPDRRRAATGSAGLGRHSHRGARRPVPRHRRRVQRRDDGGVGDERQHLQDRVLHRHPAAAARRGRRRRPARRAGDLPRGRQRPRGGLPAARRRARRVRRSRGDRQAVGRRPALGQAHRAARRGRRAGRQVRSRRPRKLLRSSIGTELSDEQVRELCRVIESVGALAAVEEHIDMLTTPVARTPSAPHRSTSRRRRAWPSSPGWPPTGPPE